MNTNFLSPVCVSGIARNEYYANRGFRANYLREADPSDVNIHRIELSERCNYAHGAAKRVASYIFEETTGVFCNWQTNQIYDWLKDEFGLQSSMDNFYKACNSCKKYANRK